MKRLFIGLVIVLIVLVGIYLFRNNGEVVNNSYSDDLMLIEYPIFNSEGIDKGIRNYLYLKMKENALDLGDFLFIDYDIFDGEELMVCFYNYVVVDNVLKSEKVFYEVDRENDCLNEVKVVFSEVMEYDFYGQRVIDEDGPMIALTFDDGPSYNTVKIMDMLSKYGVKATFFILGQNVKGNEETILKLKEMGMEIGNHTFSHKLLTRMSEEKIKSEIMKTNELLYQVIGKYPTLLRTSYGSFNSRIRKVAEMPIIIWNVDTLDWKYHNSKVIANNILNKAKDGDIILMHDIYSATANALEIVIPELLKRGYQLVTVSELFYYKQIELEAGMVYGMAR